MQKRQSQAQPKGFLDSQNPSIRDFWPERTFELPENLQYESYVDTKSSKLFFKSFSQHWLGFFSPFLYFVEKPKDKEIKCLNLQTKFCRMQTEVVDKSNHPYRLILSHNELSLKFYFKDKTVVECWFSSLRKICVLDDFRATWDFSTCISKGTISNAFWVQNKLTGKLSVAKVWEINNNQKPQDESLQSKIFKQVVTNELKALRSIEHKNIPEVEELHQLEDCVILISEFIGGSTLLKHIISKGHLPENETVYIMEILLNGLAALHNKNIVHRNLKPENIVLAYTPNGTDFKFTEFGFSCTLELNDKTNWYVSENLCMKCGTPGYMAPELFANKLVTTNADIFSMGAVLYACLTGEALFKGKNATDIISKNLNVKIDKTSQAWSLLSDNGIFPFIVLPSDPSSIAKDLIQKMISRNPARRPSIGEILKHPFFVNHKYSNKVFDFQLEEKDMNGSKRKISIEDSFSKKDVTSKSFVTKAVQSLIVPSSFFDFTKTGFSIAPEFYLEDIDKSKTFSSSSKFTTRSLKGQMITGPLFSFQEQHHTPKFIYKDFTELQTRPFEVSADFEQIHPYHLDHQEDDEANVIFDYDENGHCKVERMYEKLQMLSNVMSSPFTTQNFSSETDTSLKLRELTPQFSFEGGATTSRSLPKISSTIRNAIKSEEIFACGSNN